MAPPPVLPVWTPAPPNLPDGYVGIPYSQDFVFGVYSDTPPIDSITDSFTEPPGLSTPIPNPVQVPVPGGSNYVFTISGTPTTVGSYSFTIGLYNAFSGTISIVTYNINILAVPPSPPSDPATLRYFDNANVVPTPQGVQSLFNNEPANVWLGWDAENCKLCITNYNRTRIICCYQGNFNS